MHRFYLPHPAPPGSTLTLSGREAHHGLHVLRLRRGEEVLVLDGTGHEYRCEAVEIGRKQVQLVVRQRRDIPPTPCQVTLVQALPKGKLFDSILQKATELGAARIVPLLSERVVMHLDDGQSENKTAHWQAVVIEAIKQSGSAWLPTVEPPVSLETFLAREEKFDLSFVGSLQPDSRHPRGWFKEFVEAHHRGPQSLCVWIGPEGDFSPAELARLQSAGVHPITLGPLVLRCETAATYCLAIASYELQASPDFTPGPPRQPVRRSPSLG